MSGIREGIVYVPIKWDVVAWINTYSFAQFCHGPHVAIIPELPRTFDIGAVIG